MDYRASRVEKGMVRGKLACIFCCYVTWQGPMVQKKISGGRGRNPIQNLMERGIIRKWAVVEQGRANRKHLLVKAKPHLSTLPQGGVHKRELLLESKGSLGPFVGSRCKERLKTTLRSWFVIKFPFTPRHGWLHDDRCRPGMPRVRNSEGVIQGSSSGQISRAVRIGPGPGGL